MGEKHSIGARIKVLRNKSKLTLKELSTATGLSIGFLSQLERDMTSVAIDTLEKIALSLNVDLSYFFVQDDAQATNTIMRQDEYILCHTTKKQIEYLLSNQTRELDILPKIIRLAPDKGGDHPESQHTGEEFIYVMEGILTLRTNDTLSMLYPGDSAHFDASLPHYYWNESKRLVTIFVAEMRADRYLL